MDESNNDRRRRDLPASTEVGHLLPPAAGTRVGGKQREPSDSTQRVGGTMGDRSDAQPSVRANVRVPPRRVLARTHQKGPNPCFPRLRVPVVEWLRYVTSGRDQLMAAPASPRIDKTRMTSGTENTWATAPMLPRNSRITPITLLLTAT